MINREPLVWFLGWSLVILVVTGAIIGIIVTRPPSNAQYCIAHGGTWSHVLVQQQTHDNMANYNDICRR